MKDLQQTIIETAEEFGKGSGSEDALDFSVKSIEILDLLLDEAADFLEGENLENFVPVAGCYLFEVARRNFGGTYYWNEQQNQPILVTGEPEYHVAIMTFEKVKDRMVNGEEDNLPYYFQGYVEAVERGKKQKDYRALIV